MQQELSITDTFPFKVYRVAPIWYSKEVKTPAPKLKCQNCQEECGHHGSIRVTTESTQTWQIETLEVIGQNVEYYFYHYRIAGLGYDIDKILKSQVFLTQYEANKELEIKLKENV